jgi:uncharacterized protein
LSIEAGGAQLFSGTNIDDLGDWRPGLKAAEDYGVRHPFVEAGLTKTDVRALAAAYGLNDIAEMPSAPCLSSRVETGLRIDADALHAIDKVETMLRDQLKPEIVRCRVRADGVVIELDAVALAGISDSVQKEIARDIKKSFARAPCVSFALYARGSAFLREAPA